MRKYEWDEAKRVANIVKHGIDFKDVERFGWRTALIEPSPRYGEARRAATGYIGPHLYRVVFTLRGKRTRIISLRRASRQEVRDYEQGH